MHPTAIIDPTARIEPSVTVGPYAIIGKNAVIGDNTSVAGHAFIEHSVIGKDCVIGPYAVIGSPPQDLKYKDEPTRVELGDNCVVREFVTLNRGTVADGGHGVTKIGNNCFFMTYSHVGHDCVVGSNVVLVNCAALGGHAVVGDHVMIGGLSAVHQFVRVGQLCMIGGATGVEKDLPPYALVEGNRGKIVGINVIGLRRKGFTKSQLVNIRKAYEALFFSGKTLKDDLAALESNSPGPELQPLIEFLKLPSKRGITSAHLNGENSDRAERSALRT
ncbi:MAG: acyl-ACP--UDP-N-acetylglucosamine O-acyltransferase [Elusimicrobia bacterium]|nr:acyl-ACP--UDP-N-acetylglucosamine O-acyltransferase [Elusimicrobiota bacterium]